MKELAKIMLAFLVKTQGMTKEQAADLLYQKTEDGKKVDEEKINENLLTELLSKDKARVEKLKLEVDTTEKFNEGFNKAKKETLDKFEKGLRKEFSVKDEKLTGSELIKHIVAQGAEESKLNAEDVKKHPLFLEIEKSKNQEIEALTKAHETKVSEIQSGFSKGQLLKDIKRKAIVKLESKKPVLPKDVTAANNQKQLFANLFDEYDYQKEEGTDKHIVLKKDGTRLEDGHGNPVYLDSLVEEKSTQYFDFQKQDPKGSPGNKGGAGSGNIVVPKNEEELNKAIFEANTPEERQQVQQAFDAANPE